MRRLALGLLLELQYPLLLLLALQCHPIALDLGWLPWRHNLLLLCYVHIWTWHWLRSKLVLLDNIWLGRVLAQLLPLRPIASIIILRLLLLLLLVSMVITDMHFFILHKVLIGLCLVRLGMILEMMLGSLMVQHLACVLGAVDEVGRLLLLLVMWMLSSGVGRTAVVAHVLQLVERYECALGWLVVLLVDSSSEGLLFVEKGSLQLLG